MENAMQQHPTLHTDCNDESEKRWNFVTHVLIHDSIWMFKNKLRRRRV